MVFRDGFRVGFSGKLVSLFDIIFRLNKQNVDLMILTGNKVKEIDTFKT